MKRTIKTYFKLIVFLLGISLLLVNCEKDEVEIENTPKLTVKIIDLSDIELNQTIFNTIKPLIDVNKNSSKTSNRDTIVSNEYGFMIDTDYVKYVENGNYHSYNFSIIRETPEDDRLENLFLTLNADYEYDAFIIKYNFTKEEFVTIDYEDLDNTSITISSIDFDTSFLSNVNTSKTELTCETVSTPCSLPGPHGDGTDCDGASEIVCTGGGGPGPGPNQNENTTSPITTGGNPGTGSPGGTNTGTSTQSNPYSAATAPTKAEILSFYLGELTEEQIAWANDDGNRAEYEQLIAYLSSFSSSCPTEVGKAPTDCDAVREFGELALEAFCNNVEVDYENETIIASPENIPPDCESFDYSRVGSNDWQCAAILGIHELFTVFSWNCTGFDIGIVPQPLYFQLPINTEYNLNSGYTAVESAAYLHQAFQAFDVWYGNNACQASQAVMTQQFIEFIKDEFEERGGNVTLSPPLGFVGTITPYKYTWEGYGNCN